MSMSIENMPEVKSYGVRNVFVSGGELLVGSNSVVRVDPDVTA